MELRVGVADHLGWAVLVTVDQAGEVVDRRRIALVEPGVPNMPIHHDSKRLELEATGALVARVRASIARAAGAELDALAASVGGPIHAMALRIWPEDFPTSLEVQCRVPWEARADAVMYRQELAALARARGWDVSLYDARRVLDQVAERWPDRCDALLNGPRAALGPPWTRDHRVALASALLA